MKLVEVSFVTLTMFTLSSFRVVSISSVLAAIFDVMRKKTMEEKKM